MTRSRLALAFAFAAVACVVLHFGGVPGVTAKPTKATYVYERRDTAVPAGVLFAFDKLNREGIIACPTEQNVTDGDGNVPAQFVVAIAEAKKVGIPCLVVEFTRGPPKTVKNPKTAEQVMEAVQ